MAKTITNVRARGPLAAGTVVHPPVPMPPASKNSTKLEVVVTQDNWPDGASMHVLVEVSEDARLTWTPGLAYTQWKVPALDRQGNPTTQFDLRGAAQRFDPVAGNPGKLFRIDNPARFFRVTTTQNMPLTAQIDLEMD